MFVFYPDRPIFIKRKRLGPKLLDFLNKIKARIISIKKQLFKNQGSKFEFKNMTRIMSLLKTVISNLDPFLTKPQKNLEEDRRLENLACGIFASFVGKNNIIKF